MFFFLKQKTAYEMRISDWSSDVCSSDLRQDQAVRLHAVLPRPGPVWALHPDRSLLPLMEGEAVQLRGAVHRARRPGELVDARARGHPRRRSAQRPQYRNRVV